MLALISRHSSHGLLIEITLPRGRYQFVVRELIISVSTTTDTTIDSYKDIEHSLLQSWHPMNGLLGQSNRLVLFPESAPLILQGARASSEGRSQKGIRGMCAGKNGKRHGDASEIEKWRRSRVETDREREKRDDNDENRTIRADTSDPNRREVYWMILLAVELGLFLIYFTADLK